MWACFKLGFTAERLFFAAVVSLRLCMDIYSLLRSSFLVWWKHNGSAVSVCVCVYVPACARVCDSTAQQYWHPDRILTPDLEEIFPPITVILVSLVDVAQARYKH